MEWVVFAESEGFLTLSPARKSLTIGDCEIWLKSGRQAADAPYHAPISARGMQIASVEKTAPVELMFKVSVEADTEREARGLGYSLIELAADLLTLASGGSIAPVHVTNVHRPVGAGQQVKIHHEAQVVNGHVVSWTSDHDELLVHVYNGLRQLNQRDYACVRNAVRWLRRAGAGDEPCVQFLFLWFAVEALTGMSFVKPQAKPLNCRTCGREVVCQCGQNQRRIPHVRGSYMLVDALGIWSKKDYKNRYRLRSKVVHGDIGVLPLPGKEVTDILEAIPSLRDAVTTILESLFNGDLKVDSETDVGAER